MRKAQSFFERNVQQSMMSKVETLRVIARSGTSVPSGNERPAGSRGVFQVGTSIIGGQDRIGEII